MRQFLFALTLFALSGCNQKELLEKVSSPETQVLVKSYIDKLRARDIDGIEQASDETIKSPALRETLIKMANLIPGQKPHRLSWSVPKLSTRLGRKPSTQHSNTVLAKNGF